jgi:CubicO group peptidase (beta-lactamase class C family)
MLRVENQLCRRAWFQHAKGGHMQRFSASLSLLVILAFLVAGCGSGDKNTTTAPTTTLTAPRAAGVPDYWPTTAWHTSTPEAQGIDSARLLRALEDPAAADLNLRSLTVVRNGAIVLDAYVQPFTADSPAPVMSVTKSVISLLVGSALSDGYLTGLDQPLLSFFPERTIANRTPDKEAITLEDVLTMRSGLDCADETHGAVVQGSQDWVQSILDLPMANPPGTTFAYCTRAPHLLSAILTQTTGVGTQAYAQARLFDPLGIQPANVAWETDPQGIAIGGYGLALRTHDMAKLGLLLLAGGQWDGTQVVPADWVATATRMHVAAEPAKDYGYLIWVYPSAFAAEGRGDQRIMVVPDKQLSVVVTAAHDGDGAAMQAWLTDAVLPAVTADEPLPPNAEAQAALQTKVAELANPVQPPPALSDDAANLSGTRYDFQDNVLGWNAITLTFSPGRTTAQVSLATTAGDEAATVGLDNVYRLNAQPYGQIAVRGSWTDDDTFVVHQLVIGDLNEFDIRMDFSGSQVAVHVEETVFHQLASDFTGTTP